MLIALYMMWVMLFFTQFCHSSCSLLLVMAAKQVSYMGSDICQRESVVYATIQADNMWAVSGDVMYGDCYNVSSDHCGVPLTVPACDVITIEAYLIMVTLATILIL